VFEANIIVLIPMLLNSHAGTKYGIPFPVFARAPFGLRGANLAALLRAVIPAAPAGQGARPGKLNFAKLGIASRRELARVPDGR
jgi:hypothetical protein